MSHRQPFVWHSEGLIFGPEHRKKWMVSHASLPVPHRLADGTYRVYFASRDATNRSSVGWFTIDLEHPREIIAVSNEPVLQPGPLGAFDDHGVYPSSIVSREEKLFLYTIGWNPGVPAPLFYSSIGLATSDDDGLTFTKSSVAPLMARSEHDPCLVTSPFVIHDGSTWRMYYVSGYRWDEDETGLHSNYHIKYAHSLDGMGWQRDGLVCLDTRPPTERNIARCCVLAIEEGWEAWYSYTLGGSYRIGYARSSDALTWTRMDSLAGMAGSGNEWDSDAQAYPFVVKQDSRRYMFYNGNSFGRDGIGLSISDG